MSITKLETKQVKSGEYTTIDFQSTVINSSVALQGFSVSFGSSVDHHVKEIDIQSSITNISGPTVGITATATMEDNSSHYVNGDTTLLVMAECNS